MRLCNVLQHSWTDSDITNAGEILPHFDVRPASVRQKLTILEHRPLGPLAQCLNNLELTLIISVHDIENFRNRSTHFFLKTLYPPISDTHVSCISVSSQTNQPCPLIARRLQCKKPIRQAVDRSDCNHSFQIQTTR